MLLILSLWLPILVSAVFVFIASSILHMALPYHRKDFRKLPGEDEVMAALRKFDLPPGDYMVPCAGGSEARKDPKFKEKLNQGPVLLATIMKPGQFGLTASLVQWFLYCIVVAFFSAYITRHAVNPGAPYLHVFRFAGATAFMGYALALSQDSIWHKRSWGTTLRSTLDGLIYGLLTAGAFGWLWPR